MAQRVMHANLMSKLFPINFRELSSTVVLNDGLEQNRQLLTGYAGEESVQQFGICQAYQLQNVLPTVRGYTSAHFLPQIPAAASNPAQFDDLYVLQDPAGNAVLYSPANGNNMIYNPQAEAWAPDAISFSPEYVTVAYLKGQTYVCYPGAGLYVYNHTTGAFEQQTVPVINFPNILGVAAASGVLILWTKDTLFWSSVSDPLDFAPSQTTGAGSTGVLALRGSIVLCKSLGDGFIIYTTGNAVAAQATGNLAFPWNFSEVPNSVGIVDTAHVASNDSAGSHVAWTTSGFMEVSVRGAQTIWPELAEGIVRGYISRSDASGFPYITDSAELLVKLNAIGAEYVTISVAPVEEGYFNVAYVYDLQNGRWGKLDVPHRDLGRFEVPQFATPKTYADMALEYPTYFALGQGGTYGDVTRTAEQDQAAAGKNFAVLSPDGSVHSVVLASGTFPTGNLEDDPRGILSAAAQQPTIMLGRYKLSRSSGVRSESIQLEGVIDADVGVFGHDYTGERVLSARSVVEHPAVVGKYYARCVGDSVTVVVQGVFNLTDVSLALGDSGKRNLPNNGRRGIMVINDVPVVINDVQVIK